MISTPFEIIEDPLADFEHRMQAMPRAPYQDIDIHPPVFPIDSSSNPPAPAFSYPATIKISITMFDFPDRVMYSHPRVMLDASHCIEWMMTRSTRWHAKPEPGLPRLMLGDRFIYPLIKDSLADGYADACHIGGLSVCGSLESEDIVYAGPPVGFFHSFLFRHLEDRLSGEARLSRSLSAPFKRLCPVFEAPCRYGVGSGMDMDTMMALRRSWPARFMDVHRRSIPVVGSSPSPEEEGDILDPSRMFGSHHRQEKDGEFHPSCI